MEFAFNDLDRFVTVERKSVSVVPPTEVPPRKGLQSLEGKARLLHDLANIELQAIELGLRTLKEFPSAPVDFRRELEAITREEADHFRLCQDGLLRIGFRWGQWPVHTVLNDTVRSDDTLLERIFLVHCYLEGSGLDSGDQLLRRLAGAPDAIVQPIVQRIVADELKHVSFGVKWFRYFALSGAVTHSGEASSGSVVSQGCEANRSHDSASTTMISTMESLKSRGRLPNRGAEIACDVRLRAGFTREEINWLAAMRS